MRQRQRSLFVGRFRERAVLMDALSGGAPRVIYLHGPGGIGKTTLTTEVEHACADQGVPFFRIVVPPERKLLKRNGPYALKTDPVADPVDE